MIVKAGLLNIHLFLCAVLKQVKQIKEESLSFKNNWTLLMVVTELFL